MKTRRLALTLALILPTVLPSALRAEESGARPRTFAEVQAELARDPDYVQVPHFGRAHRSCVHELPHGALVDRDGSVSVGGRVQRKLPACAHPLAVTGEKREATMARTSPGPTPTINGWVEWGGQTAAATATTSPWFRQLVVEFVVPSAPTSYVGQTLFLFPAMEPASNATIIQPVLQYGPSAAGGGSSWTMANWFAFANGSAAHTPLVAVNPGDHIIGQLFVDDSRSCNPDGTYCHYVVGYKVNGGALNWMLVQPAGAEFSAQAGVLEVYNVSSCDQLPASGSTIFTVEGFYQAGVPSSNWVSITPAMAGAVASGLSPSCGNQAVELSNGTSLAY